MTCTNSPILTRTGTDCMRSKTKQKIIAEKKHQQRKHKMKMNKTTNARRCVTQRAASSDELCPMRIVLILTNEFNPYSYIRNNMKPVCKIYKFVYTK